MAMRPATSPLHFHRTTDVPRFKAAKNGPSAGSIPPVATTVMASCSMALRSLESNAKGPSQRDPPLRSQKQVVNSPPGYGMVPICVEHSSKPKRFAELQEVPVSKRHPPPHPAQKAVLTGDSSASVGVGTTANGSDGESGTSDPAPEGGVPSTVAVRTRPSWIATDLRIDMTVSHTEVKALATITNHTHKLHPRGLGKQIA